MPPTPTTLADTPRAFTPDATPPAWQPDAGTILEGRFVVRGVLARGGMATVLLADDRETRRGVAVKILAAGVDTPRNRARFAQEVEVVRRASHPTLVPVLANGEAPDGRPFYVMAWLTGSTLAEHVAQHGPLSLPEAVRIIGAVAAGVHALHGVGVVHRDLKPSNVFLESGRPSRVRLLDLGVCRDLRRRGARLTDEDSGAVGTPQFMAPEQILGHDVDARTDVWALGVLFFGVVTGESPWGDAGSVAAIYSRVLGMPTPSVRGSRPDLPASCDLFLARALAKEPADRYADVRELSRALLGLLL